MMMIFYTGWILLKLSNFIKTKFQIFFQATFLLEIPFWFGLRNEMMNEII